MKEFPLRLERYFFTDQQVTARSDFAEGQNIHLDFLVDASAIRIEDQSNKYGLTALVELNQEKSINPPYLFSITAFGIVSINEDSDIAVSEAQIETSGVQLLIGAIRERLAEMTSRGPWGVMHLDFVPLTIKIDINVTE